MEIVERILCWLMGIGLLVLAFRFVHKDKWGAAGSSLVLGAFLFFCGLGWVEGLAKTWIVSNINAKLAGLGKQLDDVQKTTSGMQSELSDHQKAIDKHQTELNDHQKELNDQQGKIRDAQSDIGVHQGNIKNQFDQISTMQAALALTETNIDTQQKKIEDVEFLVNTLYSKMTAEHFAGSDSNKVKVLHFGNDASQAFFTLQDVPVMNSVQITAQGDTQYPLISVVSIANVATTYFNKGNDPANLTFTVQYVKDTRQTNRIKDVSFKGNKVFLDGKYYPFIQDSDAIRQIMSNTNKQEQIQLLQDFMKDIFPNPK